MHCSPLHVTPAGNLRKMPSIGVTQQGHGSSWVQCGGLGTTHLADAICNQLSGKQDHSSQNDGDLVGRCSTCAVHHMGTFSIHHLPSGTCLLLSQGSRYKSVSQHHSKGNKREGFLLGCLCVERMGLSVSMGLRVFLSHLGVPTGLDNAGRGAQQATADTIYLSDKLPREKQGTSGNFRHLENFNAENTDVYGCLLQGQ